MGRWPCQNGPFSGPNLGVKLYDRLREFPKGEPWMGVEGWVLVLFSYCLSAGGQ